MPRPPPLAAARRLLRAVLLWLPVLLGLLHASGLRPLPVLHRLDASLYDLRLRVMRPDALDPRIVIVDIDEKSLEEQGRWPWGRDRVARLVDELFDRQRIAVLGFDVVFAEPDTSSGLARLRQLAARELADQPAFLRRLRALEPELDYDARLARALEGRPVVLGYYFNQDTRSRASGQLPVPVLGADSLQGRQQRLTVWNGYGANLPELAQAAPRAGFFNPLVDADGLVRAVPLLAEYRGQIYESLSLAVLREAQGQAKVEPVYVGGTGGGTGGTGGSGTGVAAGVGGGKGTPVLQALRVSPAAGPPQDLPVSAGAAALVPYRGLPGAQGGSFRYVPATDLIEGRIAQGHLAGRIVLVGSSAPGLLDLRATPVSETFPGVEIHAHLLSALLDARLPVRPDYAAGYEVALLLLAGGGLALLLPRLETGSGLASAAALLLLLLALDLALYHWAGLVLPLASLLAAVAGVALLRLAQIAQPAQQAPASERPQQSPT